MRTLVGGLFEKYIYECRYIIIYVKKEIKVFYMN